MVNISNSGDPDLFVVLHDIVDIFDPMIDLMTLLADCIVHRIGNSNLECIPATAWFSQLAECLGVLVAA